MLAAGGFTELKRHSHPADRAVAAADIMNGSEQGATPKVLTLAQLAEQLALDASQFEKKRRGSRVKAVVSGVKSYARGTSTPKDKSETSAQAHRCAKPLRRL